MARMTCLFVVAMGTVLMFHASSRSEPDRAPTVAERIDLQQLSWLKGTWTRREGKHYMEEVWTSPAGGTMMGMARTIVAARTVDFEFMRIVQTEPGGIVFLASPGGRCPPTAFGLTQLKGERVVFENLDHDFPQRVIYWRNADGTLHARIEGERNGQPKHAEWSWPAQESD